MDLYDEKENMSDEEKKDSSLDVNEESSEISSENEEAESEYDNAENVSDTDDTGIPEEDFDPFDGEKTESEDDCLEYREPEESGGAAAMVQSAPAYPQPQKKSRATSIIATAAFILSLVSCLLLSLCLASLEKIAEVKGTPTTNNNAPSDYSKVTDKNGNSLIWVNPEEINTNEAISNAVAKTVDCAVVIEVYSSSSSELESPSSAGSGVLYASASDGTYIVTCNHVIDGAVSITVTLNNGDTHTAQIVGTDAETDLAVLKISATGLPTIVLPSEDSSLSLGQTVFAIGNPLGVLGNSVTSGIISSLERNIAVEGMTMKLMQIDASVNSGNSGGGLFDINGQLIGIVNAKSAAYSVEGIGFAIPYATVKNICSQLIENGYVTGRPSIGITFAEITSSNYNSVFSQYPDLRSFATEKSSGFFGSTKLIEGIYITDASKVSGYAEGSNELKFGDRVLLVDGQEIKTSNNIRSILALHSVGDNLEITVIREGKSIVITVILGEKKN